ncbi:DUF4192 domain-containing protein [Mycobacterium sp. AT1]|uniref:DUF4192 domain-containing protein n=1 Tax=Mycobacterium sp. AT1 TaxID=1961706 RepID=UPI0009AD3769|nr:DUF4192 domain-containing protein [Mycobacterium sp. AT1]OPX08361.1 hypothetical protein B1790_19920 [Mycobacterium sp. AT1]
MRINLTSNTDVVNLIPALLGFVPTNSIVAIVLDDHGDSFTVYCGARYDSDATLDVAAQFADVLPLQDADGPHRPVLLVAVADVDHQRHASAHLDAVTHHVTARGATVVKRLHTPHLEAGHTWTDVDTGQTGTTADYRTSEVALQMAVEHGRTVEATRETIAAEFAPGDPAPEAEITDDTADLVTQAILGVYAALNDPDGLTPQLVANAGHLITASVTHRDALLVVSTTRPEGGATVWTRMARQLRGPARIEALTIAAACFYVGHDTVRTSIALEAAHDTAVAAGLDDTNLVLLLDTAVQTAVPPTKIRQLFATIAANPPTK